MDHNRAVNMSAKIVECVPNFSEGRSAAKIKAITDAIQTVPGVKLLHVDVGHDANRTVVTFIGPPQAVAEGAYQAIGRAAEVIDMRVHEGEHPRLGSTDVCPFVPIEGVTLDDCAEIARAVGRRVGEELDISVYFYEAASLDPKRKNLADIRRGEYEGLEEKLKHDAWQPDCGPAVFNPRVGATVIGAREFLIAYNINLNTRDKKAAAAIAAELRESGRAGRPGEFKFCKAIGWYVKEFGCAQISMNLTNYHVTPPHVVFERARQLAADRGLAVTGSELVGMIPYAALLEAGKFHLAKQGRPLDVPPLEILETAVNAMGLRDVRPFDIGEKVIGLPAEFAASLR
jgi:glutamate formiminotransferase / formiminotetrahydrofolate cyclodeaminase